MRFSKMQISPNDEICYKQISENFLYGTVGDFYLVIDKSTSYFNATKLCSMARKKFFNWKRLTRTVRLISYLQDVTGKDAVYTVTKGDDPTKVNKQVTGHYVHKDLILDVASWMSTEFYRICNRIVVDYFAGDCKILGEEGKMDKIRELEMKMKTLELEKDAVIKEQKEKIDSLVEKLRVSEEERQAGEEARKADALKSEMLLKASEEARRVDAETVRQTALKVEDALSKMGINIADLKYQNGELLEPIAVEELGLSPPKTKRKRDATTKSKRDKRL
jgi:hypothetical protein